MMSTTMKKLQGNRFSRMVVIFYATAGLNTVLSQEPKEVPSSVEKRAVSEVTTSADQPLPPPTDRNIPVRKNVSDEEIAGRLQSILEATTWFTDCKVNVKEGVVFLEGETTEAKYKDWATNLSEKTDEVVAVVNRIGILQGRLWDLKPAWEQLRSLIRQTIQMLPLLTIAGIILVITWILARWAPVGAKKVIARRVTNPILQQVGSRIIAIPILIIGFYIALRICGLTQVAATVVGGTGLIGLVVGIAFRDITENFLASILISTQRPFELGHQIEVNNIKGIVQSVTTRGTMLMTLDGNHVQIPNSVIYKSVISNLTSNPRIRLAFTLPIPIEVDIERVQKEVLKVVKEHSSVFSDPEPMVLVEELTADRTTVRVLCWIDGRKYSTEKVRSALMRMSSQLLRRLTAEPLKPSQNGKHRYQGGLHEVSAAEGDLTSECPELEVRAKETPMPQNGTNLLTEKIDDCDDSTNESV